jgi:hypothetical protein
LFVRINMAWRDIKPRKRIHLPCFILLLILIPKNRLGTLVVFFRSSSSIPPCVPPARCVGISLICGKILASLPSLFSGISITANPTISVNFHYVLLHFSTQKTRRISRNSHVKHFINAKQCKASLVCVFFIMLVI